MSYVTEEGQLPNHPRPGRDGQVEREGGKARRWEEWEFDGVRKCSQ